MKFTTKIGAVFLLVTLLLLSCNNNNNNESCATNSNGKQSKVYKTTELAQLMRDMYAEQTEWKSWIEKGQIPKDFPEKYKTIHTAEATDPTVKTKAFEAMGNAYLQSINKVLQAKDSIEAKQSFNEMVNNCVSCHKVYCPGPIKKINKLKIQ